MKKHSALLTSLFLGLLLAACSEQHSLPATSTATDEYIVAVNAPLQYFAQRLLNKKVDVIMPAPADSDPAQWRPKVADIQLLQGAKLVLLNGAGYSPWLDKISLSQSRTVATSLAAKDSWIRLDQQVTHSHGPEGDHAHGGFAFTTWMDLNIASLQAQAVSSALQRHWPEYADDIAAAEIPLLTDLDALDKGYADATSTLIGRQIIYSHPVYQYFQRHYELPGLSLHWEPHNMPTDEQWEQLKPRIPMDALLVWEATPESAIFKRVEKLGIQQVTINPGASLKGNDWLELQRANIRALTALSSN